MTPELAAICLTTGPLLGITLTLTLEAIEHTTPRLLHYLGYTTRNTQ